MKKSLRPYFRFILAVLCLQCVLIADVYAETLHKGKNELYGVLLDQTHAFVSNNMYGPVAWFDNFFSDKRTFDEGPITSFLRWRTALRWEESKQWYGRTSFHVNVKLPKASKKLKLIISADDNDDPTEVLPTDPIEPGFEKREERERAHVGLRYNFLNNVASKFHVGAGAKFELPVDPYVRIRYRHTIPIHPAVQVRFTETVVWRDSRGWKETTQLDFERLITKAILLRWSNAATFKDPAIGHDWGSSIGLQHQLSPKNALAYDASISGVTHVDTKITVYRIGVRFRRNFYREYLFYEIEPENSWPRNEFGKYDAQSAVTFRIEIHFGKN